MPPNSEGRKVSLSRASSRSRLDVSRMGRAEDEEVGGRLTVEGGGGWRNDDCWRLEGGRRVLSMAGR